jgi:hypothetical protein
MTVMPEGYMEAVDLRYQARVKRKCRHSMGTHLTLKQHFCKELVHGSKLIIFHIFKNFTIRWVGGLWAAKDDDALQIHSDV